MKRLLFTLLLVLTAATTWSQGYPVIRNFTQKEYKAHNVNFDLDTDKNGTVFVANFEGLMYYDKAEWRIIHTPGITRVTVVMCDKDGNIWVGGYNYFGRVVTKPNGELALERIGDADTFHGEVLEIFEKDNKLQFIVNDDHIYQLVDGKISVKATVNNTGKVGMTDVVYANNAEEQEDVSVLSHYVEEVDLENGMTAVVLKGEGIKIFDANGKELMHLTKEHGLYSNNVIWISYDGHGTIWGAADEAVFAINLPSLFSHFTANEGLPGSIQTIESLDGKKYVGTSQGLFRLEGNTFEMVGDIHHACWKLQFSAMGLVASTANGVYLITPDGKATQLTQTSSTTIFVDGLDCYIGEFDGIYRLNLSSKSRAKVCDAEKVNKILKDSQGAIWLQNVYGEVWYKRSSDTAFKAVNHGDIEAIAAIVPVGNKVEVIGAEEEKPFPYPLFSHLDEHGVNWLTNSEGKRLYRWKDGKKLDDLHRLLIPFEETPIQAIYLEGDKIWLGSDHALWVIDKKASDPLFKTQAKLQFRSITLGGDSILWGGFGEMPASLPGLGSKDRSLRFTYSLDYTPLVGQVYYRYKLNDDKWSVWSTSKEVEYSQLPYGSYTLTIQARQATGELTDPVSVNFSIAYPVYMRWYTMVLYFILAALLIYALFRYRLNRLEKDKAQLESIVQERTAEVVKQKDEIELKSKSLEEALNDLHTAQNELIRQEKMATVGKLTQGLIDRILNPLNYINNFSKLSEGLVKDIEANIEDEKDKMDEENYEDTLDVLSMLRGNLQKVGEHGQNTTRTLKAMEEMLKDRSGGIVRMDLAKLIRQDEEMIRTYFADDISKYHIQVDFSLPDGELPINGNPDHLSKALMSMLGNGIYAVVKKIQREDFQPEVSLTARQDGNLVTLTIRDNGIGIEDTIVNKIFDPFFTTKTTGEASGVGLYLSREIIQNYGGDIHVKSEKNKYSEFTITLPTLTQ